MMKHLNKERGAAHLVLILALVVGLFGVLGFLGYSAWQKQGANASDETVLGKSAKPKLTCSFVSVDPMPKIGTGSTHKIRLTAVRSDFRVEYGFQPQRNEIYGSAKFFVTTVSKGTSKVFSVKFAPPSTFKDSQGRSHSTNKLSTWVNFSAMPGSSTIPAYETQNCSRLYTL